MRLIFWISLLAIGLTVLGAGAVSAGSLVEFPNVSEREPKVVGYLARPDAGLSALAGGDKHRATVYPAVVVLHGCGGISSHSIDITDQLGAWGYVALAVDSLGPRAIANACSGGFGLRQAFDAYAALSASSLIYRDVGWLVHSQFGVTHSSIYRFGCNSIGRPLTVRSTQERKGIIDKKDIIMLLRATC